MARPTKYQEAYAEQARKLCLLGYTDAELADSVSQLLTSGSLIILSFRSP